MFNTGPIANGWLVNQHMAQMPDVTFKDLTGKIVDVRFQAYAARVDAATTAPTTPKDEPPPPVIDLETPKASNNPPTVLQRFPACFKINLQVRLRC